MTNETKNLGQWGEKIAQKYLINKGYKIIECNYKNTVGEIDIIGKKHGIITFFEVKTRTPIHAQHFLPEQSVNPAKQSKLRKLCEIYISRGNYKQDQEWQIDVISVILDKISKKAKINHIENAVFG